MTTRETIERYFASLTQQTGWESMLADNIAFTSFVTPIKRVSGRENYLQATKRFYSMIQSVDVRELITDGEKACALTRYALQPPNGTPAFTSDVAEIFSVTNGQIAALSIYFDSAPFPK